MKKKIERSDVWKKIYNIVNEIPRKEITSVTTELEKLLIGLKRELVLQAYKEGFDSATESLIGANKMIQERILKM